MAHHKCQILRTSAKVLPGLVIMVELPAATNMPWRRVVILKLEQVIPLKISLPPMEDQPADQNVHFLDDRINDFNESATGITDGRILSWFIRDERGQIYAGLYGWTWGGTCEVRYLWVREDHRKCGYGRALMAAAQQEAIARGCCQMVLDTHSFQAPGFYERLGFMTIGTHFGYPHGHHKYYMCKELDKYVDVE